MNDALFCSIHVDSPLSSDAMASLVAELTGGVIVRGGVDCAWARISVDDDYGTFEVRAADPDDFLGWPTLLEIMPADSARHEDVVRAVASLMTALIARGMRVLAQCKYAEDLPGGGEVAGAPPETR
ncbi:MAG TPA: hypothetical protein VGD37_12715 [Kofleriaceae bacterium]|jgi:hypothetical protein